MMAHKEYGLGIIVGRFQTIHSGHEDLINRAIELCDRVGIFVGSSQEARTLKNPFSYEEREKMLKTLFTDRVAVYPLPDIGVGNNSLWGDYVLKNVTDRFGGLPDLLASGEESRRISWLDREKWPAIAEIFVPKTIDISSTAMRDFLIKDDLESWKKYTNPALWDRYDFIRQVILASKNILDTNSI